MSNKICTHEMTYGEAEVRRWSNIDIIKGEAVPSIKIINIPPKLSGELDGKGGSPAGRHTNKKLEKIWEKHLDDSIPANRREAVVKYLMYGSVKEMIA